MTTMEELKQDLCYQLGTMKPFDVKKYVAGKDDKRTINLYSKSQIMILISNIKE